MSRRAARARQQQLREARTGRGADTCSGAGGTRASEALLLDDEANADERRGGDGEERALEVSGEEVPAAAGFRRVEGHRWRAAAVRASRI